MRKKIIFLFLAIGIILVTFYIYQKVSVTDKNELIYNCETWMRGDPPLMFGPIETSHPKYSEMKQACERRNMCKWINIKDNIKDNFYTCIRAINF